MDCKIVIQQQTVIYGPGIAKRILSWHWIKVHSEDDAYVLGGERPNISQMPFRIKRTRCLRPTAVSRRTVLDSFDAVNSALRLQLIGFMAHVLLHPRLIDNTNTGREKKYCRNSAMRPSAFCNPLLPVFYVCLHSRTFVFAAFPARCRMSVGNRIASDVLTQLCIQAHCRYFCPFYEDVPETTRTYCVGMLHSSYGL
ncbi:hypothetical protein BC835DRAFT_1083036 [Cytidiella melzeri]|nr:hypothetical protein BC835DRAFT_1083036 [Cytidiella melzeri]